jgi:putative phosphoesterase
MKKIGLLSDTHGYLDDGILEVLHSCDEIWHAGDLGSVEVIDQLSTIAPLKAVYGNIDGSDIRLDFGEYLVLDNYETRALMMHIGGYPGRYTARAKELIKTHRPNLFISGHSHILKIVRDHRNNLIHFNPGACGHHGFHTMRTLILFSIESRGLQNVQVVELGKRGKIK